MPLLQVMPPETKNVMLGMVAVVAAAPLLCTVSNDILPS